MRLKALLISSVLLAAGGAVAPAHSDTERNGWYLGLESGWVMVEDSELPSLGYDNIAFDSGLGSDAYGVIGTAGYAFDGNWRIEVEFGYRHNGINTIETSIGGNAFAGAIPVDGGRLREFTGFMNVIYDLELADRWALSLGLGIGADNVSLDIPDTDGAGLLSAISVDHTELASQALAGLSYRLGAHWDLMVNYRYLRAEEVNLLGEICGAGFAIARVVAPPVTCVPEDDTLAMTKHTVSVGLRYGFAAPPEVQVPVETPKVPPPLVRQFIIFFGFNKCNVTAEADGVLSEAAAVAQSTGSVRVKIVGHTDTVGTPSANLKLSLCRANAAKANLMSKGVAEASILADGRGESALLVETADGTKEPQNRRATIDVE
jgi:OOP family OmpA-OmpF porin